MKTSFCFIIAAVFAAFSVLTLSTSPCYPQQLMSAGFDACDDFDWNRVDGMDGEAWGPGVYELVPEVSGQSCAYRLASTGVVPTEAGAVNGHVFSLWPQSNDPSYQDGFVRLKVQAETMGTDAFVGMRNGGGNAYVFGYNPRLNSFFLNRFQSNETVPLAGFKPKQGLLAPGQYWWLQAGTVDDQLTMKYWKDGSPEPLRPQLSVTDSNLATGSFFIGAGRYSDDDQAAMTSALFDDIQFTVEEPSVEARELSIVVPRAYRSTEDPLIEVQAFDLSQGARFQEVFPADAFGDLPDTHHWITGIRYRPHSTVDSGLAGAASRKIFLSTVDLGVDELDASFSRNRGADETLVYDGTTEWITSDAAFVNGTRDFEISFDFDTPFLYDPSEGNLLLEAVISPVEPGAPVIFFDSHTSFGDSLWGTLDANAETAEGRIPGTVAQFIFSSQAPGDFDGNGQLDVYDINALVDAIQDGPSTSLFDLTGDSVVNKDDLTFWVHDLKKTWFGDANLDGMFDSGDLIQIFLAGEYEDEIVNNSTWATGDWNGNREFDSGDLIAAFTDGGYDAGPRAAVSAVPEPTCAILLVSGIVGLCRLRPRR